MLDENARFSPRFLISPFASWRRGDNGLKLRSWKLGGHVDEDVTRRLGRLTTTGRPAGLPHWSRSRNHKKWLGVVAASLACASRVTHRIPQDLRILEDTLPRSPYNIISRCSSNKWSPAGFWIKNQTGSCSCVVTTFLTVCDGVVVDLYLNGMLQLQLHAGCFGNGVESEAKIHGLRSAHSGAACNAQWTLIWPDRVISLWNWNNVLFNVFYPGNILSETRKPDTCVSNLTWALCLGAFI